MLDNLELITTYKQLHVLVHILPSFLVASNLLGSNIEAVQKKALALVTAQQFYAVNYFMGRVSCNMFNRFPQCIPFCIQTNIKNIKTA